jgi:hypothetical protein
LHTWRTAEETLRHPCLATDRPAYERAVAAVQADLARFRSVGDLVAYYALERLTLRATVTAAGAGPDGDAPELLAAVVEGAAFWRRLSELVGAEAG